MSKAKGKGGTGRGTDKKGWNRWQASANRLRSAPKPYKSKGTKNQDGAAASSDEQQNDKPNE
ncbi:MULTISPECIES: DUF3934 family protein [unclassified Paenibacillus]|uniref:DUF3934 family protein n=1 Tax=unclassified Paenibacillus TaxID=185978 RepID=UPI0009303827|nr:MULTISPECIES: DUF3934 family protein [unclassified Paenibacillus]